MFKKTKKCDLKNIWYILLGAIGGIGIMIIFYILNFFNEKSLEVIKVCISFIAIFATFGGAYFGAKLAANNALNLKEREMSNERKKDYFIKHNDMFIELENMNFNSILSELHKWNDRLLKDKDLDWSHFSEIIRNLDEIERIIKNVHFSDRIFESKFCEVAKNIDYINLQKEIIKFRNTYAGQRKKRVLKSLIKVRSEIYSVIKQIENSLDSLPKFDIFEYEKIYNVKLNKD